MLGALLLILLTAMVFVFIPAARAISDDDMGEWVTNILVNLTSGHAKAVMGLSEGDFGANIVPFSSEVAKVVAGFGYVWVFALTIYTIFKESAKGSLTMETWLRIFVRFFLGMAVIIYTETILDWIDKAGNYLIDLILDTIPSLINGSTSISMDTIREGAKNPKSGSMMAMAGGMLFAYIVTMFLSIYIRIISYSLMIELAVRRTFASFAVATIVTDGIRSPGVRFLKKYAAIYIKLVFMVICMSIPGWLIFATGNGDANFDILALIVIFCTVIRLMGSAAVYTDEILGI